MRIAHRPSPVSYTALRFDADGGTAEAWSDALLEAGALSVEITDPHAGTAREEPQFAEPGEPETAMWPRVRLCALFMRDVDVEATLSALASRLGEPLPAHDGWQVDEADWVRATQAQFGPIRIGKRLAIVPSWCEPEDGEVVIRLDPGLAFGTGSHPTTRLCLEWMLDHVGAGDRVLDYGCGSGILAIAAAKLGAARVVGTDVDAQALRASRDNAGANGVEATFAAPAALESGDFDAVVANILANPLVELAPTLASRVRSGGRLALSGILEAQAEDVVGAYSAWFEVGVWRVLEGWVLIAGLRRDSPAAAA